MSMQPFKLGQLFCNFLENEVRKVTVHGDLGRFPPLTSLLKQTAMADGTISLADGLGLQALDRHNQRSHVTSKPQNFSTSTKLENSLDLGAGGSITMSEGLGGKAIDSNEMRRK